MLTDRQKSPASTDFSSGYVPIHYANAPRAACSFQSTMQENLLPKNRILTVIISSRSGQQRNEDLIDFERETATEHIRVVVLNDER
jgi:hypothetical protein